MGAMANVILHFGFFDREALRQGRLLQRDPSRSCQIRFVFEQIFGTLPGPGSAPSGFFSSYGVLSCVCPRASRGVRVPVEAIVDLVRRTGCDVVYVSSEQRWIVEADRLADLLCDEGDEEEFWEEEESW
jgi:hypothetical protein